VGKEGSGGVRKGKGEGERNDPNIICTYKKKREVKFKM
jgi:hypothetical protein